MKSKLLSLLTVLALSGVASAEDGWVSMFNGKDLSGWKSNISTEEKPEEKADAFVVENGELKIKGVGHTCSTSDRTATPSSRTSSSRPR